jgi:hypothetical protein
MRGKRIFPALIALLALLNVHAESIQTDGLTITLPAGSEYMQGETITFAGVADAEGSQPDEQTPGYSYFWSSSIDGIIGTGVAIRAQNLSVGSHIITFQASDGSSPSLSAEKKITIDPRNLTVRITPSEPEGFFGVDEKAALKADAVGGVPPYAYIWTMDKAIVGNGQDISRTFSEGNYRIELVVKDSKGSYASASIDLSVYPGAAEGVKTLSAYIAEPAAYKSFRDGVPVRFRAGASGGSEPYNYLWTMDDGEVLSREKEFQLENFPAKTHKATTIHLTVTDEAGVSASSMTTITIEESCIPDGLCSPPIESYLNCPIDCAGKKDSYCDRLPDGICDPDCARTDDPDCACNKNRICEYPYEDTTNCPDDCPTGMPDERCDDIKDGRCDPDCPGEKDPDCGGGRERDYLILMALALAAIAAGSYLRFMRRR